MTISVDCGIASAGSGFTRRRATGSDVPGIRRRLRHGRAVCIALGIVLSAVLVPMALISAAEAGGIEADETGRELVLELNNMKTEGDVCRVSFVATNGLETSLEAISFEVVVFDRNSLVDRILVMEFGRLPVGKTRVVQFDLERSSCDQFSKILVNDVARCEGAGLEPKDCVDALRTSSRQPVTLGL